MRIIDDSGRLFGRLNLVDAGFAAVLVVLMPLVYGAYLLFQPPLARIVAVEPATISVGTTQVTVRGEHLRPYLRVQLGSASARYLFRDAAGAVLQLPPLEPGTYDIVLLEEEAEIGRLANGLVVEPRVKAVDSREVPALVAVATVHGLQAARARSLQDSLRAVAGQAQPWGAVLGVAAAEPDLQRVAAGLPMSTGMLQVRAVLRLTCSPDWGQCVTQHGPLAAGGVLMLPIGAGGAAEFRLDELHPRYDTSVDVTLRVPLPDASDQQIALLRQWTPEPAGGSGFAAMDALQPALVSVSVQAARADLRVRVPVLETAAGWFHQARVLRVGETFTLRLPSQTLDGRIIGIEPAGKPRK